jgi:tripartite-type tricarboxylate transporter receptor subunit TctC
MLASLREIASSGPVMRYKFLPRTAVALAILALPWPAYAQDFPLRPITVVIGLPAGGGVDVSMRRYAEVVGRSLGQRIIIENRPGGGGVVAAMAVKQARPDGYTLLLANSGTHATLQWLQELAYDPVKDFSPVSELFYFPSFMTVPARIPAATVVALARATPGGLTYGSQGVGSNGYLLGTMLKIASGAPLVHVPYPGGSPMNMDTVLGRLDSSFSTFNFMNEYRKVGKVKFLAVALSQRSPRIPEVPTMAEAGFPGIDFTSWFGLVAPAGTPADVVRKLNNEFVSAAHEPELAARLDQQGIEPKAGNSGDFAALMSSDAERIGKVIKSIGVSLN